MLSTKEFIKQSLELNLFFMRIMKEHAFFLESAFISRNSNLAERANNFKELFTKLLEKTISLSNGVISPVVLQSGELVTKSTLSAEKVTTFHTRIELDTNITKSELNIKPNRPEDNIDFSKDLESLVTDLNDTTLKSIDKIINYKTDILKNVLEYNISSFNYPFLIDHIKREALFYHRLLSRLQKRIEIDITLQAKEQQRFWNRIMQEHSKFIRGFLDPAEEDLIKTAYRLEKNFDELTIKAIELNDSISRIITESMNATKAIRDFKTKCLAKLLNYDLSSGILPLLEDYALRETNHYIRLLENFEKRL